MHSMTISMLQLLLALYVLAAVSRGEDRLWLPVCGWEWSHGTHSHQHTQQSYPGIRDVNLMLLFWILALTWLIVWRDFSVTNLANKYSTLWVMRLLRFQAPIWKQSVRVWIVSSFFPSLLSEVRTTLSTQHLHDCVVHWPFSQLCINQWWCERLHSFSTTRSTYEERDWERKMCTTSWIEYLLLFFPCPVC